MMTTNAFFNWNQISFMFLVWKKNEFTIKYESKKIVYFTIFNSGFVNLVLF